MQPGFAVRQIAVLYRSLKGDASVLQEKLMRAGVAYRITGGHALYDRSEVRCVLCYLRLLTDEKYASCGESPCLMLDSDDQAFLEVVNVPSRGIGPKLIDTIELIARKRHMKLFAAASYFARAAYVESESVCPTCSGNAPKHSGLP